MKNTKTLLMLVAMLFAGSTAFGQIEVNLGLGYHSGAFKMTDPGAEMMTGSFSQSSDDTKSSNIYTSFGGGLPINLGIGVPISDNLMFNADFCYWMGSETTVMEGDVTIDIGGGNTLIQKGTAMVKSNQIRFNPGMTFTADNGLYGRVALVLPLGGKTTFKTDESTTGPGGTTFEKTEGESTGSFSLGASTALGYSLELSDNMKLAFELQALALNIHSATQKLTSYEDSDGTKLEEIPVAYKETNFVDELTSSSNTEDNDNFDMTKPMDDLAGASSFGAWGFNIRFIYVLGN